MGWRQREILNESFFLLTDRPEKTLNRLLKLWLLLVQFIQRPRPEYRSLSYRLHPWWWTFLQDLGFIGTAVNDRVLNYKIKSQSIDELFVHGRVFLYNARHPYRRLWLWDDCIWSFDQASLRGCSHWRLAEQKGAFPSFFDIIIFPPIRHLSLFHECFD